MVIRQSKFSRSRLLKGITLIFTVLFTILGNLSMTLSSYAVGDLEDLKDGKGVDLTAYTFDELCSKGVVFYDDFEQMKKSGSAIQRAVYYNCKSAQEYYKWLDNAKKYIESKSSSGGVTFTAKPKNYKAGNLNEQQETEAWAQYNTYANKMTKIMARGQGEKMVGDVFGQDFDPTNAVTLAAMRTFTMVCNSVFNLVSKALMLLFLLQTGFDVLYLVIPALQPVLAPANANASGGNAGLAQGKKFAIRFNLVSNEAVEANNRGATGSVGTNGGTGGGVFQTNIALRYLTARAPLIIIAFTYFVLVATNVWTDIISTCTAFITGVFYGL